MSGYLLAVVSLTAPRILAILIDPGGPWSPGCPVSRVRNSAA